MVDGIEHARSYVRTNQERARSGVVLISRLSALSQHSERQNLTNCDGENQANSPKIHRRKGSEEAAGHKGGQEERPCHRRRQEASPLQAWDSRPQGDSTLSEIHRAADPQTALPAASQGDRSRFQNRPAFPELGCDGSPGGQ